MSPRRPSAPPPATPPRGLSRRRFIAGAASGLVVAPAFLQSARGDGLHRNDPLFSLGVASGDPDDHSVVLWTRLAPEPLAGGGMPRRVVRVGWDIATDPGMTRVIRRGRTLAFPDHGHSVRVVARGLPADHWLYFRFHALGETSRVGRTRTFPGPRDPASHMRLAVVSCQNYVQGFYPAYGDMLDQELDFIVHTGDYIYEGGPIAQPLAAGRNHTGAELFTLQDYRDRYALYRLDADLQEVHARYPFLVTWDDHEVDNNYAAGRAEETAPFQDNDFAIRRHNAYRAYSEAMALRPLNRQHGNAPALRLFRRLQFGDLADIHMLDTRQFRSDQPAGDNFGSTDPASAALDQAGFLAALDERLFDADGILDADATVLGPRQERWLARNLRNSGALWNVLAQQVMVTPWNLIATARATIELDPAIPAAAKAVIVGAIDQVSNLYNVDAWDGYPAARQRLLTMLDALRPANPVVLTGDIHSAWAANLLQDFSAPDSSDMLAAEFVCTSISSTFLALDPRFTDLTVRAGRADNPHIDYFNGLFRGYCLCDVDRERWETTYRAVGDVANASLADPTPSLGLVPVPGAPVATDRVMRVDAGFNRPGSGKRLETTASRALPPAPIPPWG